MIKGKGYRFRQLTTVNKNYFKQAKYLADMYVKKREEDVLCRILQRISNEVVVNLNNIFVDQANYVKSFTFDQYKVEILHENRQLWFTGENINELIDMALISDNSSYIFKRVIELIYPGVNEKQT